MGKSSAPPLLQPIMFLSPPPPPPPSNAQPSSFNLDSKISPSILLIMVILAISFFVSGLLHLLVRCLLRPTQRDPDEVDHVTVLQGQLQQLFHLHDAGVDQSYIDTLPVFYYKAIIGLKDPFDCAVCLCEFELEDKLRLLPKCSHAFHMECIDTWLLSHSTCPLCRSSLLSDYGGGNHGCSPIVCVLESGSVENFREINGGVGFERERNSVSGSNPHVGVQGDNNVFGSSRVEFPRKSIENDMTGNCEKHHEEKIVTVKLGKFRNVDVGEGSSENDAKKSNNNSNNNNNNDVSSSSGGNDNLGSRRCYSMGSFAYILDETTSLQVPIRNTPMKKQSSKKPSFPLKPGHRAAMSEYGCDSTREFNGLDLFRSINSLHVNGNGNGNGNEKPLSQGNGNEKSRRTESFSISRIWARGGGERERERERNKSSRRSNSEFEIDVSEVGGDEETASCYSVDSLAFPTTSTNSSSARRTLLWLMGRQNKIVHNHSSSLSSNV